jgi:hypothetical protein
MAILFVADKHKKRSFGAQPVKGCAGIKKYIPIGHGFLPFCFFVSNCFVSNKAALKTNMIIKLPLVRSFFQYFWG